MSTKAQNKYVGAVKVFGWQWKISNSYSKLDHCVQYNKLSIICVNKQEKESLMISKD
jgi:hypothetical protein